MAISVSCPGCGFPYRLRDELAGKYVTCKQAECRKAFQVPGTPVPAAAPAGTVASAAKAPRSAAPPRSAAAPPGAPSADDLASQLLSEAADPAAQQAAVKAPIKMTCAACDHKFEVPRDKEGKNVPCPDCRHIQRVPVQVEQKPADWRSSTTGGPSLRKQADAPKDVASSTQASGASIEAQRVARDLREAAEAEPTPLLERLGKAAPYLAGLGALVLVGLFASRVAQTRTAEVGIDDALAAITKPEAEPDKHPLWVAAVQRAAAEHRLRTADNYKTVDKAFGHAQAALSVLGPLPPSPERNAVLTESLRTLVLFGGTKDQIDDDLRRPWDQIQVELRRGFEKYRSADFDSRADAARRVTRDLAAAGQPLLATKFLSFVSAGDAETLELLSAVGLELLALGRKEDAAEAEKLASAYAGDGKTKPFVPSRTYQALLMGLDGAEGKRAVLPPPLGQPSFEQRYGYALGWALQGKWDDARALATRPGPALDRVRAAVAVAEAAQEKGETAALEPLLEAAIGALVKEIKPAQWPAFAVSRLAALLGRAGRVERVNELTAVLQDAEAKAWLKAQALAARLEADPAAPADWSTLDQAGGDTEFANAWLRERLARHRARSGVGGEELAAAVRGWPAPVSVAAGLSGMSLGVLDRQAK